MRLSGGGIIEVRQLAGAGAGGPSLPAGPVTQRDTGRSASSEPPGDSPLRGLIVHDDVAVQRALAVIMERCGFQVVGVSGFPDDSIPAARATRPDAIVIDLALSGDLGLRIIPEFLQASPACMVVVLSPFTALREQSRELGALSVVDPRDLRHVEDWLLLGMDPDHPCR
ncbi:MAG TPA: response regulator [Egibacteraceae bacterium]|nr:response regulator [Egibacteraceae bacterium]